MTHRDESHHCTEEGIWGPRFDSQFGFSRAICSPGTEIIFQPMGSQLGSLEIELREQWAGPGYICGCQSRIPWQRLTPWCAEGTLKHLIQREK